MTFPSIKHTVYWKGPLDNRLRRGDRFSPFFPNSISVRLAVQFSPEPLISGTICYKAYQSDIVSDLLSRNKMSRANIFNCLYLIIVLVSSQAASCSNKSTETFFCYHISSLYTHEKIIPYFRWSWWNFTILRWNSPASSWKCYISPIPLYEPLQNISVFRNRVRLTEWNLRNIYHLTNTVVFPMTQADFYLHIQKLFELASVIMKENLNRSDLH